MKILQLQLAAFGYFTEKIFDFPSQFPGFHLFYGANEAGKSTMRRALTHLFFGIPERTPDAHFHPNDQLRIAARLLNAQGEELYCYRRKGRKNTLLDSSHKPIDDTQWQAFLDGISEAQFSALFCFDHDQLRQGGEDLLSGGGDVGESLFQAGTGGLRVHEVLAELDREKEELFKARGTKPVLNQTIKAYKEACKRIKDYSLSAEQWSERAKQLDDARHQHTQLTEQLQGLRVAQNRLKRIQRTRPLLQQHQEVKTELATLEAVIILPDESIANRTQAQFALSTAQNQEQQALQEIASLQEQLNTIRIPQTLLPQKETIDELRGRLGSHQKAARDLPGVRTEMRTVENEARILLQRLYPQLELSDVATQLVITSPQREQIKQLAEQAPVLQEKQRSIQQRLEELTQRLAQQQHALAALPLAPDLTLLRAALARACKYGNVEELQTREQQELRSLTEKTAIGIKQMGLWSGQLEELETLALPRMERIEHFERRFQELENDQQRIKERLLEARRQNEVMTKKINALRWAGEVPTEEALNQARVTRQQYWQMIKSGGVIINTYLSFEKAMFQADEVADRLRREAHRVAEYGVLLAEQDNAQRELTSQTKKWHKTNELLERLQTEWEASWTPLGIKPWTPAEMRSWLNECLNLRQQFTLVRERRQQVQDREQLITELCQEVNQTFMEASQALPATSAKSNSPGLIRLADLIERGNNCVNEITQLQRQRENLQLEIDTLAKEQQRAENIQQQIDEKLIHWQQEWAQALTPLHLPADTLPETARNVLNDLDQVLNKIDRVNGLRRRVELMNRDAKVFQEDVINLAQKITPELMEETAEYIVPELSSRLSQAEKDATRHEQLQQRLQIEQHRLSEAKRQLQLSQTQLQTLFEQAHCEDLTALEQAEQHSMRKKELQRELLELEQQLTELGEGMSYKELAEAAATVDIEQLPGQLQNYHEQIQKVEQERSEIDQHIGELRILLKQMDGNAAAALAADEAQLALSEIQNLTERYMQVHVAASVLRKSIERYREQNQAPVLKRASELFQKITLTHFCGLKTDYGNQSDQPILVGLRTPEGAGIPTTGMSDGTRDQLYFALRIASIERYLTKKQAMPMILDDILINFDNERSRATLAVLGELSQQVQIFFLTHHPHLVELAQEEVSKEYLVMHEI
jgi:uncharacterized protein YhaN